MRRTPVWKIRLLISIDIRSMDAHGDLPTASARRRPFKRTRYGGIHLGARQTLAF